MARYWRHPAAPADTVAEYLRSAPPRPACVLSSVQLVACQRRQSSIKGPPRGPRQQVPGALRGSTPALLRTRPCLLRPLSRTCWHRPSRKRSIGRPASQYDAANSRSSSIELAIPKGGACHPSPPSALGRDSQMKAIERPVIFAAWQRKRALPQAWRAVDRKLAPIEKAAAGESQEDMAAATSSLQCPSVLSGSTSFRRGMIRLHPAPS